jgi:serine/threonine-protein kinase
MGEVWKACHERTKGRVAVKILLPEMGRKADVMRRFQREVEITSSLNHPNIVRVSDADKLPDGRPYLVMEFLEGRDLSTEKPARVHRL